jgi:hypothetical protein
MLKPWCWHLLNIILIVLLVVVVFVLNTLFSR